MIRRRASRKGVAGAPPVLVLAAALLGGCVPAQPPTIDAAREAEVARDPAAMMRIGRAASASGDTEAELAFSRRAAQLRPKDVDAQLAYARALSAAGRVEEALAAMRTLQATGSADPRVPLVLGRLLVLGKQPRTAIPVLQDALRRRPTDDALLVALGVALDNAGEPAEAQAQYRRAMALKPDSVAARANLGLSLALTGDYAEAMAILRPLRAELYGTGRDQQAASVDNTLALVHGLTGDAPGARAILRRTLPPAEVAEDLRFYHAVRGKAVAPPGGAAMPAAAAQGGTAAAPGSGPSSGLP